MDFASRCSRIFLMTDGSSMHAIILTAPPQRLQIVSRSLDSFPCLLRRQALHKKMEEQKVALSIIGISLLKSNAQRNTDSGATAPAQVR